VEKERSTQSFNIIQLVNDGIRSPTLIVALLLVVAYLLGQCIKGLDDLGKEFARGAEQTQRDTDKLYREIRILGVDMENTNAILIREGKEKPGDRKASGPTQPKE
jgi:hypothetical protein